MGPALLVVAVATGWRADAVDASMKLRDPAKSEILVGIRPGTSRADAAAVLTSAGGSVVEEIPVIRTHVVRVPEQARDAVIAALSKRVEVEFAEPNRRVAPVTLPDDPYFAQQWHLPKMGLPAAWAVTTGDWASIIAILDSGVDAAHPDLAGKIVAGWNFYDGNADTSDVYGHGTKVAGAAAAASNNGIGVCAPGWDSSVMPIRVTDTTGYGYYSAIAQGITWAADRGARIMNVSFAGVASSASIASAARYARTKGALVVAAAGNCACDDPAPETPDLLSIGSTNSIDGLSSFSSRGAYVDLSAPGSGIWTTARGGGYVSSSGTSFASPMAAGVIALMMSANTSLMPGQIESILESTAVDLGTPGHDSSFGFGRIDAASAVREAAAIQPPPADLTAPSVSISNLTSGASVSGGIAVNVVAFDNVGVASVELRVDGAVLATDVAAPWGFSWNTAGGPNGTRSLQAIARDAAGNVGYSPQVSVNVQNPVPTPAPTPTPRPKGKKR